MNHNAIYALYPNVVYIDDTEGAFDAQGKKIKIDIDAVNAWVNPNAYKFQRQNEYPSIQEQLDTIFHGGIDGWKKQIQAVKDKYPK
jgi:hypothetical protein